MPQLTEPEDEYHVPGLDRFLALGPFYSHPEAPGLRFTEGVNYIIETLDADWVITEIHRRQSQPELRDAYFQRWLLWVENPYDAGMICYDRDGNEIVTVTFQLTDFQVGETTIYMIGRRLFLPH